jgi:hypothetical protein
MPLQTSSQVFVQRGSQVVGMTESANGVAGVPIGQLTGYYVTKQDSLDIFLYENNDDVMIKWGSHRNRIFQ